MRFGELQGLSCASIARRISGGNSVRRSLTPASGSFRFPAPGFLGPRILSPQASAASTDRGSTDRQSRHMPKKRPTQQFVARHQRIVPPSELFNKTDPTGTFRYLTALTLTWPSLNPRIRSVFSDLGIERQARRMCHFYASPTASRFAQGTLPMFKGRSSKNTGRLGPLPTILRSGPYRMFFYSADQHEPLTFISNATTPRLNSGPIPFA